MSSKKFILILFLFPALLAAPGALAQTSTSIPESLLSIASGLGCKTMQECETAFNANPSKGIDLAEKYNLYQSQTQKELAKSYKEEILSKLASADNENFDETVINLAKTIISKNKNLAKTLSLTDTSVKAAETIVNEVKSTGVNIDTCSKSASSLTREELVSCLEASKKLALKADVIKTYIPTEKIIKSEMASKSVSLEEALARGDYPELGKTAEEAGAKCLRPGSESLTVCDEIASKYFGEDGLKELARARSTTKETRDYYSQSLDNLALKTPSGETVIGKDAIKTKCDEAFKNRDVALAKACGDFAVKNGFSSQADVDKGITLIQSFTADKNININDCNKNPQSCSGYIPDVLRGEYAAKQRIIEILSSKLGFDPSQCSQALTGSDIEKRCIEGSRQAIPELKNLISQFPGVQQVINDIERKVVESEEIKKKIENVTASFQNSKGPGGCQSAESCYEYCRDPAHGAECIAFGAKAELFNSGEAVRKYQEFDRFINTPAKIVVGTEQFSRSQQFTTSTPPPQYPSYPQPTTSNYYQPYSGPAGGLSPECVNAVQNGDFERAKNLCAAKQYQNQTATQEPKPCLIVTPKPCGEGQYRKETFVNNCPSYGECVSIPGFVPKPVTPCPALSTVESCPAGQKKIVSYSSPECGTYYSCAADTTVKTENNTRQKSWFLKDGSIQTSIIFNRTDKEYTDYIASVEAECRTKLTKETFRWRNKAGNSDPANWKEFGIPDCSFYQDQIETCPASMYWNKDIGKCIDGATDPFLPGDCGIKSTETSCKATTGCNWLSENGKKFCASSSYVPKTTNTCNSYTSYSSCVSQTNCSWSNNSCYYSGQDYQTSNWTNKLWTFKNGTDMSSILNRTDKEYLDYITGIETQCKTINKENFCWKNGAGDQSSWQNFGIPDCSGTCTTKTTYSSSCPSFAHNMGGYCMLNNDSSRCAEYGSASAESGYTASVCKTRSASMTQSTSSTVSYPGDTNSCPGFAYSKWDSTGRRYCELNNARSCDYNYPSYLTNGSNYKPENCPSTSPSNTTSTVNDSYEAQKLACSTANNIWNSSTNTCEDRYAADKKSCADALGTWNSVQNYCQTSAKPVSAIQTCPSGQTWYMPPSGGAGYCVSSGSSSSGSYTTGSSYTSGSTTMQRCFYTNANKNGAYVGYTVWCERDYFNCRQGSQSGASIDLTGVSLGPPSSCDSGWSGGSSATACNNNGSCEYGESSGSCPSDCSGSYGGSYSSCPSGQYWNGSACVGYTTSDYAAQKLACETAYGTWNSSSNYCQYSSSGGYASSTSSCPSGQYWNGSTCVSSPSSQLELGKHLMATMYTASHNLANFFKSILPFAK